MASACGRVPRRTTGRPRGSPMTSAAGSLDGVCDRPVARDETPLEKARGLSGGDAVDRLLELELERSALARLEAAEDAASNRLRAIPETCAVDAIGAPVEA